VQELQVSVHMKQVKAAVTTATTGIIKPDPEFKPRMQLRTPPRLNWIMVADHTNRRSKHRAAMAKRQPWLVVLELLVSVRMITRRSMATMVITGRGRCMVGRQKAIRTALLIQCLAMSISRMIRLRIAMTPAFVILPTQRSQREAAPKAVLPYLGRSMAITARAKTS
jgi:hypothetical protein